MELSCNTHAASFVKGAKNKHDDVSELQSTLGLAGEFIFTYDYPLSTVAKFSHTLTPDMTGEDLLVLGRADYERIYKEEEAADGDPGHISGMLNRARSEGPYGIWGHDISDLYFESIEVKPAQKHIEFGMGS